MWTGQIFQIKLRFGDQQILYSINTVNNTEDFWNHLWASLWMWLSRQQNISTEYCPVLAWINHFYNVAICRQFTIRSKWTGQWKFKFSSSRAKQLCSAYNNNKIWKYGSQYHLQTNKTQQCDWECRLQKHKVHQSLNKILDQFPANEKLSVEQFFPSPTHFINLNNGKSFLQSMFAYYEVQT